MYVRLAFAVAAHLESEILIVDEVLAVGDAEFQKKCLGKMGEVSKGEGRTVLFVSHNMGAVMQLCRKGIFLRNGSVALVGGAEEAINFYSRDVQSKTPIHLLRFEGILSTKISLIRIFINDQDVELVNPSISPASAIRIKSCFDSSTEIKIRVGLSIYKDGARLFTLHDVSEPEIIAKGNFESHFTIPPLLLRPGLYSVSIGAYEDSINGDWLWGTEITSFEIIEEWYKDYELRSFGFFNVKSDNHRVS
jgi:lipopolysaccharide transport system ATP-binding protein